MLIFKKRLLSNWKKTHAKGQIRFIISYGMIIWGVSTAIGTIAFMWLFAPLVNLAKFSVFAFIVFPLLGILLAVNLWRECERESINR